MSTGREGGGREKEKRKGEEMEWGKQQGKRGL